MSQWLCHVTLSTVVLATLMMPSVEAQEPAGVAAAQPGYVYVGSSMYPSPQPNIPIWTGSTFVPTPALAPHEMLYPHTYRALYPPFYHRVKGHYYWTPFGIKSHEKWQLQGTMVQVKYRSHYPLGFHPPKISTLGGPWE
jgi:hypothetical protein